MLNEMNRGTIAILVMLLFFAVGVQASQIQNPRSKTDFYKSCYTGCERKQMAAAENKFLLPVPFVIETYCACVCTRASMRADQTMLERMGAAALQGRDLSKDPSIVNWMQSHAEPCQKALFE